MYEFLSEVLSLCSSNVLKGDCKLRRLINAVLHGECDAESRGLRFVVLSLYDFFLFMLGGGLSSSRFIFGNSKRLFLPLSPHCLSLTSESSEVSKLMSNRLAVQTAKTTLHKTMFGILAHWVLA